VEKLPLSLPPEVDVQPIPADQTLSGTGVLATFLRYSHEQGLAGRLLDPAELFAPETHDAYLI
jgi:hypothetical protein